MAKVERAPAGVERDEHIERLYREQGARMWHAVLGFTGDPEVASDAVAETFAQALKRGDQIRDAELWLWRTVFLVARGAMRDRVPSAEVPESSYEMEEPDRELAAALASLSEATLGGDPASRGRIPAEGGRRDPRVFGRCGEGAPAPWKTTAEGTPG